MPITTIEPKGYINFEGVGVDRWNNYAGTDGLIGGGVGSAYPIAPTWQSRYVFLELPDFGNEWNNRTITKVETRIELISYNAISTVPRADGLAWITLYDPDNVNPDDWNIPPRNPVQNDFVGDDYSGADRRLANVYHPYTNFDTFPTFARHQIDSYLTEGYDLHPSGYNVAGIDVGPLTTKFENWRSGTEDKRKGLLIGSSHSTIGNDHWYNIGNIYFDVTYDEVLQPVDPTPDFYKWGFTPPLDGIKTGSFGWFTETTDVVTLVERYIALLIEQWKKSDNMKRYLKAFLTPMKRIESTLKDMQRNRYIATASGAQLDIVGEIVGISRGALSDDQFRTAIYFQIYLNQSKGTPELLISFLKNITGSNNVKLIEIYPATIQLVFETINPIPPNLKTLLENVAPAGVEIILTLVPSGKIFGYDGEGGLPPDTETLGWGEDGAGFETEGGQYAEDIQ